MEVFREGFFGGGLSQTTHDTVRAMITLLAQTLNAVNSMGLGEPAGYDDWRFSFAHPAWLLVPALLGPVAIWWIVRQHRIALQGLPSWNWYCITVVRLVAVVALMVTLADPGVTLRQSVEVKSRVLVMVDRSASMGLPTDWTNVPSPSLGTPGSSSRWDQSRDAVTSALVDRWPSKIENANLKVLTLNDGLQTVLEVTESGQMKAENFRWPEADVALGSQTRLGDALGQMLSEPSASRIAAMVMVTDGRVTAGTRLSQVARDAQSARVPVHAVRVGPLNPPPDVALDRVHAPAVVHKDDTPVVDTIIESRGFDGQLVTVSLVDENDKVVDSHDLSLNERETQPLRFNVPKITAEEGTVLRYRLRLEPPIGDRIIGNNQTDVAMVVRDDKRVVWIWDGSPRWDYRFLRNLAVRDKGLTADARVVDSAEAEGWPKPDQNPPRPDVLILGDVDPSWLTPQRQEIIRKWVVEDGMGLVVQAGPHAMPHKYVDTPLAEILPIVPSPLPGKSAPPGLEYSLELTPEGRMAVPMQLGENGNHSEKLWTDMPAYYWHADVARVKPASQTWLARPGIHPGEPDVPVLVTQQVGAGQVAYVGVDSSWRWRRNVGDRFFYRFWGQLARAVGKQATQLEEGEWKIMVDPSVLRPGQQAQVEAFTRLPANGSQIIPDEISVTVGLKDAQGNLSEKIENLVLRRDAQSPRLKPKWVGLWRAADPGTFRFSLTRGAKTVQTQAVVINSTEEYRQPWVDEAALARLANETEGRLVTLDQLPELFDSIEGRREQRTQIRRVGLWDNRWWVIVMITLLSIEIGLRRWWGLN